MRPVVAAYVVDGCRHGIDSRPVGGVMSGRRSSASFTVGSSHCAQLSAFTAIGIRSWMRPISSVAVVVMIVYNHSSAAGSSSGSDLSFHTSYRPASASGEPSTGQADPLGAGQR